MLQAYIEPEQGERLKVLSRESRVPASTYVRHAMALLFAEVDAGRLKGFGIPSADAPVAAETAPSSPEVPWHERDKKDIQEALEWAAKNPLPVSDDGLS